MNSVRWTGIVLALALICFVGCQKPAENGGTTGGSTTGAPDESGSDSNTTTSAVEGSTDTMTVAATILCGKCGEAKGSAACCAADAEVCACGKHKGSALCCVELSADAAGKDICKSCGHVAEADHTCDASCEKCAECGLHKGSPACCKLKS